MKTEKTQATKPRKRSALAKTVHVVDKGAPASVDAAMVNDEPGAGVGVRLRYVRELHGLSQRELARRAGLNHGTVGCIEKETISPSVGSLRKILDSLPMTLSEFFSLDPGTETQVFFPREELLEVGAGGISLQQVGHNLKGRPLQILLERYAPGAETALQPPR